MVITFLLSDLDGGHKMKYNIIFYEDDKGNSPVQEFLDELQVTSQNNKKSLQLLEKVILYLEILERRGTRAGYPYTKHIEGDIWELRPKNHRILFFGWEGKNIVLLHTFQKKSKKTPRREIQKAKREMKDWKVNGLKRTDGNGKTSRRKGY